MKRLLVALSFLLTLAVVAVGAVLAWGHAQYTRPGPLDSETTVRIPAGSGLPEVTRRLAEAGVIDNRLIAMAGARATGQARQLKAGEFAFPPSVSPRAAIEIIVEGRTVVRKVTLPEGITSAEAVARVREAEGLKGLIDEVPPEGSLLPETYHYHWGDSRAELLARMRAAMDDALDELWPSRQPDLPFDTKKDALTLASIVEKETGQPDERRLVAGVFVNRLRKGMRLQSDPTVRYAITRDGETLDRALTRSDLRIEDPYNTYRNGGLPPGPIANPGRAAIKAVLDPAETDYLYFVADGTGGHAFAETLREHNRNAAEWRRIRDGDIDPPAE